MSQIVFYIDEARVEHHQLRVAGWAASKSTDIARIAVLLNGAELGDAVYGFPRPDVAEHLDIADRDTFGFSGRINLQDAPIGECKLIIRIYPVKGRPKDSVHTVELGGNPIRVSLDAPAQREPVYQSKLYVQGWAISEIGNITSADVYIDEHHLGSANYGSPRPDVAAHLNKPDKQLVGFMGNFETRDISAGSHDLTLIFHDDAGNIYQFSRRVEVLDNPITANIDAPEDGLTLYHPNIGISGWAFSETGTITSVDVVVQNQVIGTLNYGHSRPDVARHFDDPNKENCGFRGEVNVPPLRPGAHQLTLVFRDDAGFTQQAKRTFTVLHQPIEMGLDTPRGDAVIHEPLLPIKGWAFSKLGAIIGIEVFHNQKAIQYLHYGALRTDVAEVHLHPRSLESGFSGTVVLPEQESADYHLTVVAVDNAGNTAQMPIRVMVDRSQSPTASEVESPHFFEIHIESPQPKTQLYSSMHIKGWAYDGGSKIVKLTAEFGNRTIDLQHGLPRPDVVERLPEIPTDAIGFEAYIPITPVKKQHNRLLTVHAIDAYGNRKQTNVALTLVSIPEKSIEVHNITLVNDIFEMQGRISWRDGVPPYKVNFKFNDIPLASCPATIDDPDIAKHYSDASGSPIKNFRIRRRLRLREIHDDNIELTIQIIDSRHQGIQHKIKIERTYTDSADNDQSLHGQLTQLLAERSTQINEEVAILDWDTGLNLKSLYPERIVFSPLPTNHHATLPYLDNMVDIVIYPGNQPAYEAEAKRVANFAVIRVDADGNVQSEYLTDAGSGGLPATSIIIPVYNKKEYTERCLLSLKETLPRDFQGEVIIADDLSSDGTDEMVLAMAESWPQLRLLRNKENKGFLLNCNGAAEAAIGDYVVFMNNDMEAYPGWFEALMDTFRTHPDAGAVGGKLIFPEGTLQEAGGLIFNDASGYNFGQDDLQPDYPLYNYVREVDYCSGALLATPRDLFLELGGFDVHYKPAYYEDADYCFKIWDMGKKVYYQPRSEVMHHRHTSYSMDSYKGINAQKFAERWQDFLATKPPRPPAFPRETLHEIAEFTGNGKRVLFFAWLLPKFDETGGLLRPFILISQLKAMGWSVSYYARDTENGDRYIRTLQEMGIAVYAGPRSTHVGDEYIHDPADLIKEGQFDLVMVSLWQTATEIIPAIRQYSPHTKVIVDSSDLYFQRMSRDAHVKDYRLENNYGYEMVDEINIYADAEAVFTVSVPETEMVNNLIGSKNQAIFVPNTLNTPYQPIPFEERSGILVVGSYHYPPNAEQVRFLLRDILPHVDPDVLAENPLHIVGINMPDDVRQMADSMPNVKAVGWVPSMAPFMAGMRLSVTPLKLGSGTKIKVINAMLSGLPVVCTTIGAEGLDIVDGEHAMITDDPKIFAQHIEQVLTDKTLWEKLSSNARILVEQELGFERGIRYLTQALDEVMQR